MVSVMRGLFFLGIICLAFCGNAFGAGSFADNNDGTITDSTTALMWQKSDDGVERTWDGAVTYCEGLTLAGYSDWQLPKIHMLENLIEVSFSPTINPVFTVKPSYYWSASESRTSVKSAKYVNFFYGNTYAFSKDNTYYSICVRDISASISAPLQVTFTTSLSSENDPLFVTFSSHVTGGMAPFFYEWDFGDGDFSSLSNPTHRYQQNGNFKVVLTISDNDGMITVIKKEIGIPLVFEVEGALLVEPKESQPLGEEPAAILKAEKGEPQIIGEVEAAPLEGEAVEPVEIDSLKEVPLEAVPEVQGDTISESIPPTLLGSDSTREEKNYLEAQVLKPVELGDDPTAGGDGVKEVLESSQEPVKDLSGQDSNGTAEVAGDGIPGSGEAVAGEFPEYDTGISIVEPESVSDRSLTEEALAFESEKHGETVIDQQAIANDSKEMVDLGDGQDENGEFDPQSVNSTTVLSHLSSAQGVLRVFASKNATPAQSPSTGQGLLAYSFTNALNGDADWNKDGKVTVRELKGYLGIAIDNLSQGRQEAILTMNDGDFSLCADGGVTQVLAIGVDSYSEDDSEPLSFAGSSAEAVAQIISEKCSSWKKLVLTGSNTVRTNVFRSLVKMAQEVDPSDTFIFYFAGASKSTSRGINFLVYDTLPQLRELTGIFYDDLAYLLVNIQAANVIMLFEAGPYGE